MVKEKSPFVKDLTALYKDIIGIKVTTNDTFKTLMVKFYFVMRKWGICQGEWTETGSRTVSTGEWCMCYQVFLSHITMQTTWMSFLTTTPKELLAYGKQPENLLLTKSKKSTNERRLRNKA